jgi:hypothetical protein
MKVSSSKSCESRKMGVFCMMALGQGEAGPGLACVLTVHRDVQPVLITCFRSESANFRPLSYYDKVALVKTPKAEYART